MTELEIHVMIYSENVHSINQFNNRLRTGNSLCEAGDNAMKTIKFLFSLTAVIVCLYLVCQFWFSPEYKLQIKNYLVYCGIILHGALLSAIFVLYAVIKE